MLALSFMLVVYTWLVLSRYGSIRLERDDNSPEIYLFRSWRYRHYGSHEEYFGALIFYLLEGHPLPLFTISMVVIAVFIPGLVSLYGDLNPSKKIKLSWAVSLGSARLRDNPSGDIAAIKSIVALGSLPFVFVLVLLVVNLLKALKNETRTGA